MVKERLDVGVHDPVHLGAGDPGYQGIQRIMLAAPGPEPIREPKKVLLVDRIQHLRHGTLDDLVLERRDGERALTTVRLRYIPPPGRLRPIGAAGPSCAEPRCC